MTTYGNLIDVQPFNNQLAYVDTSARTSSRRPRSGRVEAALSPAEDCSMRRVHVHRAHGHSVVGAEMPGGKFGGVAGEYRVRNVLVNGEPPT